MKAQTGSASEIVFVPYDKAYEAGFEDMPRRVPDLTKIHKLVGYEPKVQLNEIIETSSSTCAPIWPSRPYRWIPMKFRVSGLVIAVFVCSAAAAHAQAPLTLQISGGRVTLHAQNVPVRTILAEWARLGHAVIVNGDRIAGAPVTLELEGVSERQALDIILRGVSRSCWRLASRAHQAPRCTDRIMILPTSVAPRDPPPAAAAPIFPGGPGGIVRPIVPRQAEDQNGNDDGDAAQGNDGIPLGRPVPIPRPAGIPVGGPVAPPIAVAPDNMPPQTPAPVVVTPSDPFGLPAVLPRGPA